MTTAFSAEIFREYDIRGIADRDLTGAVIESLGRAFARYLGPDGPRQVTVGYDARLSSPRLRDAISRGLSASGLAVVDLGLCPTPALYFSLYHLKPGAGVMITGSHNPAEFNGFKLCVGKETIYGEEIQKLRRIMEELGREGGDRKPGEKGSITTHPILPDYRAELKERFRDVADVSLTVVVDSGNGTAGPVAPEVLRSMGCTVIELFSDPDGRFPNHHPDPTIPKNLTALTAAMKEHRADMGIAFDGDSDRIGVVDEQGQILWGDQLMVLFSRDILQTRPGATFVSEVKCSQTMYDDIRKNGGKAIMWKTGHSLIKAKMKEAGAALAGEMSGHMFFADRYFGYDDAIYAACRAVELLQKTRKRTGRKETLSSLIADLPRTFSTPEIRFDCPDNVKFKVVDRMRSLYNGQSRLPLATREVITVDGIRAVFEKGWGLVRASNTQPVLVMRFEATDQASLERIRSVMEEQVKASVQALN
ncbi:MAG: phosphomannomutase/phosphoglucomutase [Nitrospiraceae bacterium]|nr:phosphomannomutase/phosphoglucomutase [Nitrospiraceae bacterium]